MHKQMETPVSRHIFMFAFKWNYMASSSKHKNEAYRKFSTKIDLLKFDEKIINLTQTIRNDYKKSMWIRQTYEDEHIQDYNEYSYYYHNVRDAIYTNNPSDSVKEKKVNIYRCNITEEEKPQYIIKVLLKNHYNAEQQKHVDHTKESYVEREYTIDISKIELKVYDTGVGILSFFADNYNEADIEDINRINNYGRRIYPQFIKQQKGVLPTQKTKETYLANQLSIKLGKDPSNCYTEMYSSDYETEGNRISNSIMGLLGEGFKTGEDALRKHTEDIIAVSPLSDDRMFVICWYVNKVLTAQLKERERIEGKVYYSYIHNDKWYKYIFMEEEKSCQSHWMMQKILKHHTYERWIEYGTLYGISNCSFVCLTDGSEFAVQNISVHMTTIYYQMMCLVLAQKASILRFEDELTDISNHSKDIPIEAVEEVYQNYLQFINGIYFREVTAQDQGIELYTMAQHLMRIDIDVKELKEEIGQLFQYVSLRADKETNRAINALTYLNTLILVPALVTGFFGMNIFGEGLRESWSITDYNKLIIWTCIWIITVGLLPFAIIKNKCIQQLVKKIPETCRKLLPWIIIGGAVLIAILL
ncbi:CorA family divalent cation transporter [Cellulosilyticum sp. I15G10I2]|uniref:CorA family divalent cation transporter n=1 Tax=Cellulosilyticum sp. I15G10I2 TaxID=1892843 RepID=UPI00085CA750|nr:CorA family divalent cation transporter [Cellulosilyticum sp. I15G10I2]